jgi:hypothetical protein
MDGRRRGGSRLFAMDGASAGQRRALKPSVTTSACLRETARLAMCVNRAPMFWRSREQNAAIRVEVDTSVLLGPSLPSEMLDDEQSTLGLRVNRQV